MRLPSFSPVSVVFLAAAVLTAAAAPAVAGVRRGDFPSEFVFGAGSSAYQVEGAAAEGGRKGSIWDSFAHAGRNADKSNADIGADQYHKYKEDVKLLHDLGMEAYRFSISWSRLIPDGRGAVNKKGLEYYNNLINELLSHGIQSYVTLVHFDLPQALQDRYNGYLGSEFAEDFTAYADTCFGEFGDRVKHWVTFNEPNLEIPSGYDYGTLPPGRCSYPFGDNCTEGDSTTEIYRAAHNVLLAHSSAASLYKRKYQVEQGGYIGLTMLGYWVEPSTRLPQDIAAAKRLLDFHIGWFMEPLIYGTYPTTMKKIVGSRLPSFTAEESQILAASCDFIGINHYGVYYVVDDPQGLVNHERDYMKDISIKISSEDNLLTQKRFLEAKPVIMPSALRKVLDYIKVNYGNPPIMIHENGFGEFNLSSSSIGDDHDIQRANYLQLYIETLLSSIRTGSNVNGYFVWSFLDSFEWMFGYTARYGLCRVEFQSEDRARHCRLSARWYAEFLRGGGVERRDSNEVFVE